MILKGYSLFSVVTATWGETMISKALMQPPTRANTGFYVGQEGSLAFRLLIEVFLWDVAC